MNVSIRKVVANAEDILIEGGRPVAAAHRIVVAAAVLQNPWIGKGFVEDLKPEIQRITPQLSEVLVLRLLEAIGAHKVEAYGKAAVVGTAGEIEHAAALIHTLRFANELRKAINGKAFMPFTNKRVGPGSAIDIPLRHIEADGA